MEVLVLPAELLKQNDSPGSALFLATGPSGFLAGARVMSVMITGHTRSLGYNDVRANHAFSGKAERLEDANKDASVNELESENR